MNPRSQTLFHFTKDLETLKKILKNGFWPRYCLEDTRWHEQLDAETVAFPMVCFCDIPLSKIHSHLNFYGKYGLGVTKEWAINNKINPILYLAGENTLSQALREIISYAYSLEETEKYNAIKTIRYIYQNIKPTKGLMTINNCLTEKDFHLESEWRFVPRDGNIEPYLLNNQFNDKATLEAENEKTYKNCRLKITPTDIKYIFVEQETDIPEVIKFIQSDLNSYPFIDTHILMSRITSIKDVGDDI